MNNKQSIMQHEAEELRQRKALYTERRKRLHISTQQSGSLPHTKIYNTYTSHAEEDTKQRG